MKIEDLPQLIGLLKKLSESFDERKSQSDLLGKLFSKKAKDDVLEKIVKQLKEEAPALNLLILKAGVPTHLVDDMLYIAGCEAFMAFEAVRKRDDLVLNEEFDAHWEAKLKGFMKSSGKEDKTETPKSKSN